MLNIVRKKIPPKNIKKKKICRKGLRISLPDAGDEEKDENGEQETDAERGRQTRLIHVSTGTRSLSLRFPLMSMRMAKLVRWVQEQVLKDTECSNSLDTKQTL